MADRPRWRRAFDRAERAVGEPLEELTSTEGFAAALARIAALRRELRRRVRGVTASVLHLANLPAQSDVARLSRQLASLEHQVRELRAEQRPNPVQESPDAERAESD